MKHNHGCFYQKLVGKDHQCIYASVYLSVSNPFSFVYLDYGACVHACVCILFQLEAIPSVAETIASEGWDLDSCKVQTQSFAKMSSFASRTIELSIH